MPHALSHLWFLINTSILVSGCSLSCYVFKLVIIIQESCLSDHLEFVSMHPCQLYVNIIMLPDSNFFPKCILLSVFFGQDLLGSVRISGKLCLIAADLTLIKLYGLGQEQKRSHTYVYILKDYMCSQPNCQIKWFYLST